MSAVKLGVNLCKALPLGDTEHLDAIKNAGFDAFFTDSCNRERSLFWAEEAAKRGLVLQSFHAPFGSVHKIWQDGDEGEQILRELEGCVINAWESGVGIVVLHPFIGFKDHSPTKIGEERFLRLARLARDKGIRLATYAARCIENATLSQMSFWLRKELPIGELPSRLRKICI